MTEVRLTAVLEAEGGGDVAAELRDVREETEGMSAASQDAGLSLTDLKSGFEIASKALGYLKQAYDATVGSTLAYATQVRDLSRISGESAEATSALIQVADDMTVSYETLQTAAEKAAKRGIAFNTDQLAELADEYNALPPGMARAQFAMERFGNAAGPEMEKLLQRGSTAIRDSAEEAKKFGAILTDADVKNAQQLERQLDDLGDRFEKIKVQIGAGVIPALNEYLAVLDKFQAGQVNAFEAWGLLLNGVQDFPPAADDAASALAAVTYEAENFSYATNDIALAQEATRASIEASTAAHEALTNQYGIMQLALGGGLGQAQQEFLDRQKELNLTAGGLAQEIATLESKKYLTPEQQEQLAELKTRYSDIKDQIVAAADAHDRQTKQMVFDLLQQRVSQDGVSDAEYQALLTTAEGFGLVDKATVEAATKIDGWLQALEDGQITQEQFNDNIAWLAGGEGFSAVAQEAYNATRATEAFLDSIGRLGPRGGSGGGGGAPGRARGGPVSAGQPYTVGERGPELFVPDRSGTIVPNGAGNVTVNVSVGSVNSEADIYRLAEEIKRQLVEETR